MKETRTVRRCWFFIFLSKLYFYLSSMDDYYHSEPIDVSAVSVSAPDEPIYSSFPSKVCQNDGNLSEYLTQKRWPDNMQTVFIQNVEQLPIRFFICDDSGSMTRDDGTVITKYQGKFK
jgi:hypothetical protein